MAGSVDPTTLLEKFGLSSFRAGQRAVVDALADGKDVMCVMPTGGGKSLCYQLPSLAREGTTIVVSPLIALMKDQVDSLIAAGINAAYINSSQSAMEQQEVEKGLMDGDLKLVYVSPEKAVAPQFISLLKSTSVFIFSTIQVQYSCSFNNEGYFFLKLV